VNLAPVDVAKEMSVDNTVVVVDIREPSEIDEQGAIPGAVAIPRGVLEFRADATSSFHHPALRPDRRVLLYCTNGQRSVLAAAALRDLGFEKVAHVEGGFAAWRSAGFATTSDVELQPDVEDTARPRHRRPRLVGTMACAAFVGVAIALFGAFGGGNAPEPRMATAQPPVTAPAVEDPLINRFGRDSDWAACRMLQDPLVIRFGRCALLAPAAGKP
jgi:rhodanese-related sulfurtransferase